MKTLKFGIMCKGRKLLTWQLECIEKIHSLGFAKLDLVIMEDSSYTAVRPGIFQAARNILFLLYRKFFVKPAVWNQTDASQLFSGIDEIRCTVDTIGGFSEYFRDEDIDEIREHDLDFILRFGFGIIRGDILEAARYGVWSFHHGDESKYRGAPSCFWEIFNGDPVSGAILQRLNNRLDGGVVLKRGYTRTVAHSYNKNIECVYTASVPWPAQVCLDIIHGDASYIDSEPSTTNAPIYYKPGNLQMLFFLVKKAMNYISHNYQKAFIMDKWDIGIKELRSISDEAVDLSEGRLLNAYSDDPYKFIADPFLVKRGGVSYIFHEDFDGRSRKGHISYISISHDGRIIDRGTAIKEAFHLSYPCMIEHDGDIYCIPEAMSSGKVRAYRAEKFPEKWVRSKVLMEGKRYIDSTVFRHGDKWWLMCSEGNTPNVYASLLLFYANDLFGPWTSHPMNPVKTDITAGRPAGKPFEADGVLYRPAQDCSQTYGGGITLAKVVELNEYCYREEIVQRISPPGTGQYMDGTHTLTVSNGTIAYDVKRIHRSPMVLLIKARCLIGKCLNSC